MPFHCHGLVLSVIQVGKEWKDNVKKIANTTYEECSVIKEIYEHIIMPPSYLKLHMPSFGHAWNVGAESMTFLHKFLSLLPSFKLGMN